MTEEEANRAHSGFIYMTYGSTLLINNTSAEHINAKSVGLISAAEQSYVQLLGMRLKQIVAADCCIKVN